MEETLRLIVESLVEDKEQLQITTTENEKDVNFEIKVSSEDMGRIIGKRGKMARAIRTIMKSLGMHESKRVNVEIVE